MASWKLLCLSLIEVGAAISEGFVATHMKVSTGYLTVAPFGCDHFQSKVKDTTYAENEISIEENFIDHTSRPNVNKI